MNRLCLPVGLIGREGVHTIVPLCSGQGTNLDMYPFLKN